MITLRRGFILVMVMVTGFALVAPAARAANLSYVVDTNVSLGGFTYSILAGSAASTVIIGPSTLTVTVPAASTFTLKSAGRFVLNASTGTQTCSSSDNQLAITGPQTSIVITPDPFTTCTMPAPAGGGGGGGSGGTTPPPATTPPTTTSGTVVVTPTAGGITTYTPADTGTPSLKVTVPANAVGSNTTITAQTTTLNNEGISLAVTTASGVTQSIGLPIKLTALSGTTAVSTFSQALTLTFTYTDAMLPAGASASNLTVLFFNTATNTWDQLVATVDTVNHTVSVQVSHFTVFTLALKTTQSTVVTPSSTPHPNGTLIINNGTIYLIRNQQRAGFRTPEEYFSQGYKFSQAVTANTADLALPDGGIVKALEGTLVLDKTDNRTVYMVGVSGTKRGFTTATVFKTLGYTFNNLLKVDLSDYPAGAVIDSAAAVHPEGALVTDTNGTIWWVRNGQRQGFQSAQVYFTYGFTFGRAVPANTSDMALPQGALVLFRDGTLVNQNGTIYLISDGQKRAFASAAALTNQGFSAGNAITANVDSYQAGASL